MYDDLLGKEIADPIDEAVDEIASKKFMDKLKKNTDCLTADCSQCDSDCMYAHLQGSLAQSGRAGDC